MNGWLLADSIDFVTQPNAVGNVLEFYKNLSGIELK